jgi:anti-sigma factor RsiW
VACNHNETLLQGYFDGELDLLRSLEFEAHLKSCPDCSEELNSQRGIRGSLRAANLLELAPESLRMRVRAALPRESEPPTPIPVRRSFTWESLAVAAAILIAIFLGARVLPRTSRQQTNLLAQEIVASHIRSLQPGHLFDVQSTDQHTVKPWFDGKLDFAPPVVDLKDKGFPLIGGRLDYVDQGNAAALVYQRQKHLINVLVWPEETKPAEVLGSQTIHGYNLVFWWRDGMYFCAISDLNLGELGEFVKLLQQ